MTSGNLGVAAKGTIFDEVLRSEAKSRIKNVIHILGVCLETGRLRRQHFEVIVLATYR